jgi:hypothetical protein
VWSEVCAASGVEALLDREFEAWFGHRPSLVSGKAVLDLACSVAAGADWLEGLFSTRSPTDALGGDVVAPAIVSAVVHGLACDLPAATGALRSARAAARARAWAVSSLAGPSDRLVVDVGDVALQARPGAEGASRTRSGLLGFRSLLAVTGASRHVRGEALAAVIREDPVGAADHVALLDAALAQIPGIDGARVVVSGDPGVAVPDFLQHVSDVGLAYSSTTKIDPLQAEAVRRVPSEAWSQALGSGADTSEADDGEARVEARVADVTDVLPEIARRFPEGARLVARRSRPSPGAATRPWDDTSDKIAVLATNIQDVSAPVLESWHSSRVRAERSIPNSAAGHGLPWIVLSANKVWLELLLLAEDLMAWTRMLQADAAVTSGRRDGDR